MTVASSAYADGLPAFSVPVLSRVPSLNGGFDATWSTAAKLPLDYDFTYRKAASEPTTVYVAQENGALDIAFVAVQREPLTASQVTDGPGVASEDNVTVFLFPQGTVGFAYSFSANARGARYQTSTENTAYTPQWSAVAKITSDGYSVDMRIPLNVMRSGGSTRWRAQFARTTVSTGGEAIWSYVAGQRLVNDPSYAGTLSDIGIHTQSGATSTRPRPRLELYGLGEMTTRAQGGDTSRAGADLSVPITSTSSFVATVHPDYSNVEVDQQTISPNAFQRQYSEVRPFFTQLTQYFDQVIGCVACPTTLYTPAIPTFRDGYAVEGTEGAFSFGDFDATGLDRSDQAEAFNYTVKNLAATYGAYFQQVGVDLPGFHDRVDSLSTGIHNKTSNLFFYADYGEDRGSATSDPGLADYCEVGTGYASATTTAIVTYQSVGAQYAPADGFVAQSDTAGIESNLSQTWNFSPSAALHDISLTSYSSDYRTHIGQAAQVNASQSATFDLRDLIRVEVFTGASNILASSDELLPFNTNGIYLGYKVNTTTPTSIQNLTGAYYHGRLDSWTYITTQPVARGLDASFETDENQYATTHAGEQSTRQWLERASLDWQFSRDASFDVGARRLIGPNLPVSFQAPDFTPLDASNVSVAFHFLSSKDEYYVVYGDPNSLSTKPALYLKWIRYIGAEKGT